MDKAAGQTHGTWLPLLSLCVRKERETGGAISVCRWGGRETQAESGRILRVRFNWRYGDCSHEIKRRLLLGRKVMTNLDSIFESRDITLPTKVRLVKVGFFQ